MKFKILTILALCILFSAAVGAVGMDKSSPQEMLKSLKTAHDIEEAGSDTYGVGGNINIDTLSNNKGS